MLCYHPNDRDEIRRAYLPIGSSLHKFNLDWFLEFGNWLEYSVPKVDVFCLHCYLMRYEIGENKG
jgi:hypothetical protein